ncbi:AAA family ATPase [Priestia megaterium]|uniref:AAA family ATPase n=1 Tax=Priestia megaterium TaxID=1404 RepID=UPI000BFE69C3|nr:AAA family ATPase [Priestia megaterium]PGQ88218.1 hypothetical protein COA18_04645 [Priestia megaterium]
MSVALQEDIWIKEVEVVNFQSIKQLKVKLVNGTNAFVGESNSGKTALIRAIRWCLRNKPNGDYFITKGQKEAMVKIKLSNDKTIERRKGGGVNFYRVFYKDELVGEYTGFGTSVPPEVVEAHGVVPIAGDIYFQFSEQLESAFLLSLRPSKRAEVLGNLEELERIDSALSGINDDIRQHTKSQKELKKSNKLLTKEIKTLQSETDRVKVKIETLKLLKEGLESKNNLRTYLLKQLERLKDIQQLMKQIDEDLFKTNRILDKWPKDLEERVAIGRRIIYYTRRLNEIKEELSSIQYMKEEKLQSLDQLKEIIDKQINEYNVVNLACEALKVNEAAQEKSRNNFSERAASLDLLPMEKDIGKFKLLFNHIDRLRKINQSIEESDELVKEANENIENMLFKFSEALQEAQLCPTCGQETHGVCTDTVKNII